jgi:two-component system NtrC family sensor kinase
MATDLTAAGLAHDLNNVFETIQEGAELLRSDPKYTRLAATIQRSVKRGVRIVEDFSEIAQELSGTIAIDAILDNAIQQMQDFLDIMHSAPIEFTREIEPSLRLPGMSTGWERVFVNFFMNAAQVMPKECEVVIRACKDKDGGIQIQVENSGPGIPEEVLPHIFEAHFSTKKPRSKSARSGLGLHIVQTIVTQNGGTVQAANRTEGGAQFTILVPAV